MWSIGNKNEIDYLIYGSDVSPFGKMDKNRFRKRVPSFISVDAFLLCVCVCIMLRKLLFWMGCYLDFKYVCTYILSNKKIRKVKEYTSKQ